MHSRKPLRKDTKVEVVHLTQKELAARWRRSEACLERWRSAGIGPKFLKLCGRVLYRQADIEAYEAADADVVSAKPPDGGLAGAAPAHGQF